MSDTSNPLLPPSFQFDSSSTAGGANALSGGYALIYSYTVSAGGYAFNSNLMAHSDSVMGDWAFQYDTLNRLTAAAPAANALASLQNMIGCYGYDSFGNRTLAGVTERTWTPPTTPKGLHFHLAGPLGTRRVQANALGAVEETCQSLFFGEQLTCVQTALSTASDATEHHFTGKERDTESGLDYFGARYYANNMGRFMSPDWSAKYDPVPYARLDNPQSLNLYAYVGNNPMSRVDADGHDGHMSTSDYAAYESATAAAQTQSWMNGIIAAQAAAQAKQAAQQQNTTSGKDASHYVSVSYYPCDRILVVYSWRALSRDPNADIATGRPTTSW